MIGWDYRLLLDIKYPALYQLFYRNKWFYFCRFCYEFNELAISQYSHNLTLGRRMIVIVSDKSFQRVFEKKDYEVFLLHSLNDLRQFVEVSSPDVQWILAGYAHFSDYFRKNITAKKESLPKSILNRLLRVLDRMSKRNG